MRAEFHLGIVYCEMHHATTEFEELFARIAIALVLFDSIFNGQLGETVLQLEGGNWKPVDEQRHVERMCRVITAIAKLARDGETVQREALGGFRVAGGRRAVEEISVMSAMLYPLRRTSMTPRFPISPCSRARNFWRAGLSLSRSNAETNWGCVAPMKACNCTRSTVQARS